MGSDCQMIGPCLAEECSSSLFCADVFVAIVGDESVVVEYDAECFGRLFLGQRILLHEKGHGMVTRVLETVPLPDIERFCPLSELIGVSARVLIGGDPKAYDMMPGDNWDILPDPVDPGNVHVEGVSVREVDD